MNRCLPILIGAGVLVAGCASIDAYLNGTYNSAMFPPLDAPADEVAIVSQSSVPDPACVIASVDDAPVLVNPNGNGDGLWAKRVALKPGPHQILTGWRLPGRYSPDAFVCTSDLSAGHRYEVSYDVSMPHQARAWLADAATGDRVGDCAAKAASSSMWPFSR